MNDSSARAGRRLPGMGALIGICAGFGLVLGIILGDRVIGLLAGAAVGSVTGAVGETLRRGPAKRGR
jgi:hypothetical protein